MQKMGNQYSFLNKAVASKGNNCPLNDLTLISDPRETPDDVMSAVIYSRHGHPDDCLELMDNVSRPIPSPGQILVKVHAYGINPVDVRLLDNPNNELIVPLPKIIGCDFSGTVLSTSQLLVDEEDSGGPADGLHVGDKIFGVMPRMCSQWGSAAEYVTIAEDFCAKVPTGNIDLVEAAGLSLDGLTVHQGLRPFVKHCTDSTSAETVSGVASTNTDAENVHTAGKRVLVHGGSSGLGLMAIQYCKQVLGMHVITTVPTQHMDFVKNLGADVVLDSPVTSLEEIIQPVDLVFDTQCGAHESRTIDSSIVQQGGWYLTVLSSPSSQQAAPHAPLQLFSPDIQLQPMQFVSKLLREHWNKLFAYFQQLPLPSFLKPGEPSVHYQSIFLHPNRADLEELLTIMEAKQLHTVIDRVFPMTLEKIKSAHSYVASGKACGKVIIRVQPTSSFPSALASTVTA